VRTYINNLNRLYQTGNAREHSYRGDLQELLNRIINNDEVVITNEPAHIRDVGAPDYSITRGDIPIGYIEAKDIEKDLSSKSYKEQFERYKNALDNLIITNYLDFWFYKNGELTHKIAIAKIKDNTIIPLEENFKLFFDSIKDFSNFVSQSITSPLKLAKLMAGKARLLENVIEKALLSDEESEENNSLKNQLEVFRQNIIHDITPQSFADIYAQTIAYGLFTARLHDKTLQDFSRQEAQNLIPKSNPFLRGLFNYIGGVDCDERLVWIIDSLAEIFLATDLRKLFASYKKDPIVHFYETFLGEYNPALRKARGVWYTPLEIVDFIVRSVDEVLKNEFGLEEGLIDDSKIKIKIQSPNILYTKDGKKKKDQTITKELHRVQVLDPATGTGTFLAQTIKFIKENFWGGSWSSYVENSLIPRLNGFELLMASYAMAHLKLDMILMDSGYKPTNNNRLNIYLTNSLESYHEETNNLFSSYLANEAKQADRIKKDTPVMVVMGNPPYSGVSANNSEFINNLLDDYKKEWDGSKLKEKNPKWINDDYVKFIRYAQFLVDKNKEGVLAYITNHSYIDNPTFRGMRYSLLKSFDKIYILDLHGNAKKKEVCPDGSKDENVFDIMQGVAIIIAIKTTASNKLAKLYKYDLYGKRETKYNFLDTNSLNSLQWEEIRYKEPNFYFFKQDYKLKEEYEKGFKIDELFKIFTLGLITKRDKLVIDNDKHDLINKIKYFINTDKTTKEVCDVFGLPVKDKDKWDAEKSIKSIKNNEIEIFIKNITYRPFDIKNIFYHDNFVARPNKKIFQHFIYDNYALIIGRQGEAVGGDEWNVLFCTNNLTDQNIFRRGGGTLFPLYLYQENSLTEEKTPNFNKEIVDKINANLGFEVEPLELFDYIYAVLHSPSYREKYKEFLKIDFPRVPYPTKDSFKKLVEFGSRLRKIHLLEDSSLDKRTISFIGEGSMKIENKLNKKDTTIEDDKVTINLNKEFAITDIPKVAWEFYIGGYQPAQKYLKDRVGRNLSRTELKHYNRIVNALVKTDEIMKQIDVFLKATNG